MIYNEKNLSESQTLSPFHTQCKYNLKIDILKKSREKLLNFFFYYFQLFFLLHVGNVLLHIVNLKYYNFHLMKLLQLFFLVYKH